MVTAAIAAVSALKRLFAKDKEKISFFSIINCLSFSEKERQLIIEKKEIFSLSLANNILRAETAAIASVTIVNYHLNLN